MKGRRLAWLRATWDDIRTSMWLVPALMVAVGAGLALTMLALDAGRGVEDRIRVWWLNSGDGEDARNLLSTLLSAVITMASMAFSVTVVALTLAANAYGSRLIRIFRADLRTQLVLGTFAMTIVYCLIVLRSVHGKAPIEAVPHISVTVGTALAFVCVLALLAFIQGVARGMVADEVVRRVRRELDESVSQLPLRETSAADRGESKRAELADEAQRITLPYEGYVQAVAYDDLVAWAEERNVVVGLDFRAGDFIVDGDQRVWVHPPRGDPNALRKEIGELIVSGDERTPTQDLEFSIRHLVEIAVRALSPGINDPFTATVVIDRLRGALSRATRRQLPPEVLAGPSGRIRVYREVTTYEGLLDAAFHQIRQAGSSHPAVLIQLLEGIARMAEHTVSDDQRQALTKHADLARAAAERDVPEPADRDDVERSYRAAVQARDAKLRERADGD